MFVSIHRKDAAAAGNYAVAVINPTKKYLMNFPIDVIYQIVRWAAHWAIMALNAEEKRNVSV